MEADKRADLLLLPLLLFAQSLRRPLRLEAFLLLPVQALLLPLDHKPLLALFALLLLLLLPDDRHLLPPRTAGGEHLHGNLLRPHALALRALLLLSLLLGHLVPRLRQQAGRREKRAG